MTRLLKADLHGILDGLEEPEEVVKQTIRDMEEALAQKVQTLAALHATLQRLTAEEAALARTAQEIETHIDSCFQAGNETLARSFIRKRLETAWQARQVGGAVAETRQRCELLQQTMAEQRAQLAAVVQQLHLYTARRQQQADVTASCMPGEAGIVISEDEVAVAFLEEQRRRAGGTPVG
jgi:phage shock protein A